MPGRGEAGRMSRGDIVLRRRSGGVVVVVDEPAGYWAAPDPVDGDRFGRRPIEAGGGALVDAAVGPVVVAVVEVLDEELAELAFVPDQGAVEQFGSGGAHEPFGGGVGAWRSGWGVDHVEPGWW